MPDSPLSVQCQAEWLMYLRFLQAMTRDHATTETWVWPEEPCLSYPDDERDDPDEPAAVVPTPEVPPPPADEPPG